MKVIYILLVLFFQGGSYPGTDLVGGASVVFDGPNAKQECEQAAKKYDKEIRPDLGPDQDVLTTCVEQEFRGLTDKTEYKI